MGPPVETVPAFVLGWLARRTRDPAAGATAAWLIAPLSELFGRAPAGGEVGRRFLARLGPRLRAVVALGRACPVDDGRGGPAFAPWSLDARRVGEVWDFDDRDAWFADLLELADEGNGLALAVVAGCLDEAVDPATASRPSAAALRRLRDHDEAPFARLTVPPAPGAPWDADDYLVPPGGADVLNDVVAALAALDPGSDPGRLGAWRDLADAYASGQPVPKSRLFTTLESVRGLCADAPPGASAAIAAALAAWAPAPPAAGPRAGPPETRDVPLDGSDPLPPLAAALVADGAAEARAFGRRLAEAASAPDEAKPRLVLGCLIYLDQLGGGTPRRPPWASAVRDRLLEAARGLAGCEVLDAAPLVGLPARQVADLATAVGVDDQAPPAAGHRVTRVEAPGYALRLPDGSRQVLIKARVLVAPG